MLSDQLGGLSEVLVARMTRVGRKARVRRSVIRANRSAVEGLP
jgi:hypothetical protein